MPVITIDWWQGNDPKRRAVLVAEVAATVARVAECPVNTVTVIVRDCEPGHGGDPGPASGLGSGPDSGPGSETSGPGMVGPQ